MTAFARKRRNVAGRLQAAPVLAIALVLLILAGAAAALWAWRASAAEPDASASATIDLPAATADAMVAATSASASEIGALGEKAVLINAALPFSNAPVEAANPFAGSGDQLDQRRALLCLTQAVYYEAGFEPIDGRRAVAQVVLNRLRHPAFPKSVCGVVYQGSRSAVCQFSFVCDGSLYRVPSASAWNEARKVAEAALAGYVEKSVGTATHYHADYVAPRWAPMLAKITKIGAHIFYRWPRGWGEARAFNGRYIGEPLDPLALRPPLRTPEPGSPEEMIAAIAEAGPVIARAPNDVGGLVDVSKGWTPSIPAPDEISSGAARLIAQQQGKSQDMVVTVAAATSAGNLPAAGTR